MSKRRGGSMPRHAPLRRGPRPDTHHSRPETFGRQATSTGPVRDDFNDTALGRELTARWGNINRPARAPHLAVVTTMSMLEALNSARWQGHVLEWVHGVGMGVKNVGPKLECLAGRGSWTMTRAPVAVVVTELVPLNRAMISGLCQSCVERGDLRTRIFAALERDLGLNPATARLIHREARA